MGGRFSANAVVRANLFAQSQTTRSGLIEKLKADAQRTRSPARVRVGRAVRHQEHDRHLSRTPQFGQTSGLRGTSPPLSQEFWTGASQLGQRYKRFQVKVMWTIAAATSTKAMKQIQKSEVGSGCTPSQRKNNTRIPASITGIENRTCRHVLARRF